MAFPTTLPSYGSIPNTEHKVPQIARDVEAIASKIGAGSGTRTKAVTVVFTAGAYTLNPANGTTFICNAASATSTITMGGSPAAGDMVNILVLASCANTVSVADASGTITFTASKIGSVKLVYNGSAWNRVGAHYQQS